MAKLSEPIERARSAHAPTSKGVLHRTRVVAEALFSSEDHAPPKERIDWLVQEIDDFLSRTGATRWVYGLSIWVVAWMAPLLAGRFASLGGMDIHERARVIGHMEDRFGAPVLAVKALLCTVYYEHPDAQKDVGYDGAC